MDGDVALVLRTAHAMSACDGFAPAAVTRLLEWAAQTGDGHAHRCLEMAAEAGHGQAQFELGMAAWRARRERKSNDVLAVAWLLKARARGVAAAASMLDRVVARFDRCEAGLEGGFRQRLYRLKTLT